jgi:hypothetical protein
VTRPGVETDEYLLVDDHEYLLVDDRDAGTAGANGAGRPVDVRASADR